MNGGIRMKKTDIALIVVVVLVIIVGIFAFGKNTEAIIEYEPICGAIT